MTGFVIASLLIATGLALAGALLGIGLGTMGRGRLELLIHCATGALLAITAFDILPEAKSALSWPAFWVATCFGFLLLWTIGRFVWQVCPSCAITHTDQENSLSRRGSLVLLTVALGIHCVLDGLAISTGTHISGRAEIGALLGVGVHKLPEGLALGLLLIGARYSKPAAMAIAAGVELMTVAGGFGSAMLTIQPAPALFGTVFAVIGGGFMYLVVNALDGALTHRSQLPRTRWIAAEVFSFGLTGLAFWVAHGL